MKMWGTNDNKLSKDERVLIEDKIYEFYTYYAEESPESIVDFMDSLSKQLEDKNWLSEKQIAAVNTIVENCREDDDLGYSEGFYP